MSTSDRLSRELPGILEELYLGPIPAYRDDLLSLTARTRQRPGWTFLERWIPMSAIDTRLAGRPAIPWRMVALLALLLVALVIGAVVVGSSRQRELPPPFGLAGNGSLVYEQGGDIYLADVETGATRAVVTASGLQSEPQFSPDGSKFVFLEQGMGAVQVSIADADGSNVRPLTPTPTAGTVTDLAWSPDGRTLLANQDDIILLAFDTTVTADPRMLLAFADINAGAFQPPFGDHILYQQESALYVAEPDGTGARLLVEADPAFADGVDFSSAAWSPDGKTVAFPYPLADDPVQSRIFLIDADGTDLRQATDEDGRWVELLPTFSPDGTYLAFDRWTDPNGTDEWHGEPTGVVTLSDGTFREVGPPPGEPSNGFLLEWSPDGTSLLAKNMGTVTATYLIDVADGTHRELPWQASVTPTWQRVAKTR